MDIPAHWRHLLPGQLPTSLPPFLLPSFSPSLTLVVVLSLSLRTSFLLTFSLSPSSPYTHTHLSPFLSFLPPSHTPTHTHTPLSALLISPPTHPPNTQDIQKRLKQRQGIDSFLIKPVQRISQYQLLLRDLQKSAVKSGLASTPHLNAALQQMQDIPKRANDAMTLSMICGYDGAISASGQLIMHVSGVYTSPG